MASLKKYPNYDEGDGANSKMILWSANFVNTHGEHSASCVPVTFEFNGPSLDVVSTAKRMWTRTGGSGAASTAVKWRSCLAGAGQHMGSAMYIPQGPGLSFQRNLSTAGYSIENSGLAVQAIYGGTTTNVPIGAMKKNQLAAAAQDVVKAWDVDSSDRRLSCPIIWQQIWWSVAVNMSMGWSALAAGAWGPGAWVARPPDIGGLYHRGEGLNGLIARGAAVGAGREFVLELTAEEVEENAGAITLLLNLRPAHIVDGLDDAAPGVPRGVHVIQFDHQCPSAFIVMTDRETAYAAPPILTPAVAGLGAGVAPGALAAFQPLSNLDLTRAMTAMAGNLDDPAGCELGLEMAILNLMSEYRNGVQGLAATSNGRLSTQNNFMHSGNVSVPSSRLLAGAFKRFRKSQAGREATLKIISNGLEIFADMKRAVSAHYQLAYFMAVGQRNAGLEGAVILHNTAGSAPDIVPLAVPAVGRNQDARLVHNAVAEVSEVSGSPVGVAVMQAVTRLIADVRISTYFRFIPHGGAVGLAASPVIAHSQNIGEVITGASANYLSAGVLTGDPTGLPGFIIDPEELVPSSLGVHMMVGNRKFLAGENATTADSDGVLSLRQGTGCAGHTIPILMAMMPQSPVGSVKIAMSAIPLDGQAGISHMHQEIDLVVRGDMEFLDATHRAAGNWAPHDGNWPGFTSEAWKRPMIVDSSGVRGCILNAALDSNETVDTVMRKGDAKSKRVNFGHFLVPKWGESEASGLAGGQGAAKRLKMAVTEPIDG